jgi:hypothetical protein
VAGCLAAFPGAADGLAGVDALGSGAGAELSGGAGGPDGEAGKPLPDGEAGKAPPDGGRGRSSGLALSGVSVMDGGESGLRLG